MMAKNNPIAGNRNTRPGRSEKETDRGIRKQPWRISLVRRLEESLIDSDTIRIMHDGSNPAQQISNVQVSSPSYYTKKYQLVLDGEPVNTAVKFVYNLRDGVADFDIYYHKFKGARDASDTKAIKAMDKALGVASKEGDK